MPELPEIETTLRGIAPHLTGRTIIAVTLRTAKLRSALAPDLAERLTSQLIGSVERRGKYLLLRSGSGTLLLHLGMSGHLRLIPSGLPAGKHDHVELHLDNDSTLRLTDPRKFGTLLWLTGDPFRHPLLSSLGPEPLSREFSCQYLYDRSRGRKVACKIFIMNCRIVVGAGNIYANEALFRAGISPALAAGQLTRVQSDRLVTAIKQVLTEAIALGGTTLHDYLDAAGKPGYFRQELQVYGRGGEPCRVCGSPLQSSRLGGRSTCWCPLCQG